MRAFEFIFESISTCEQEQIRSLQTQLQNIKEQFKTTFINLIIAGVKVDRVISFVKTEGNPKSDLTIIHNSPKPQETYVSLKCGGKSKFKWGGFIDNPSTYADFIQNVKDITSMTDSSGKTVSRLWPEDSFHLNLHKMNEIKKIMYGENYVKGGERGPYNVDFVVIGDPELKHIKDTDFELTSETIYANGNEPGKLDIPYLVARYTSNRNDAGIQQVRFEATPISVKRKSLPLNTPQEIDTAKNIIKKRREGKTEPTSKRSSTKFQVGEPPTDPKELQRWQKLSSPPKYISPGAENQNIQLQASKHKMGTGRFG